VIAELAEELGRLAGRRDQLEREIEALFGSHPRAPVVLSIPGIGVKTGASILTEIGDVNRFPTAAQLTSYGLAPVTRQSGSSIRSEQKSRRGNQRLKNALWLSAFCSLRNGRSAAYYARKRGEGKKHNAAIVVSPAGAATSSTSCSEPGSPTANYRGRQPRPPQGRRDRRLTP